MMFALSFLPLMILIAGAIDFQRVLHQKSQIQSAVDAAVLAATRVDFQGDREQAGRDYIEANLQSHNILLDQYIADVKVEKDNRRQTRVQANVSGRLKTSILGLAGIPHVDISVSARAEQSAAFTEIALVLDVSSSMNGAKIANLKPAATDFVDALMRDNGHELTAISLIPFGGTVNLGALFDTYVINDTIGNRDPDAAEYQSNDLATDGFTFTNGGNCIEYDASDFGIDRIPNQSRGQFPPSYFRYAPMNPYCPEDTSEMFLNSSDSLELQDRINAMTLSDGTGMETGMLWGLKALSPSMKGRLGGDHSDRPEAFDKATTRKFIVLMADGGITSQHRPLDPYNPDTFDPANLNVYIERGNIGGTGDTTVNRFLGSCADANSNGIEVFTIGFMVPSGSLAADLLRDCATRPENYFAASTVSIDDVFEKIALSIGELQITQ